MLIAIEYDKTYTAAEAFWRAVLAFSALDGIKVICVTRRTPDQAVVIQLPDGFELPVVYAGDRLKRTAAEEAGYEVDIWIDDEPGTIEKCRILDWD